MGPSVSTVITLGMAPIIVLVLHCHTQSVQSLRPLSFAITRNPLEQSTMPPMVMTTINNKTPVQTRYQLP
jgi:hypothetical protein